LSVKDLAVVEINNVIGANEWQENIDNNAFTNGIAITSLRYATQAAKELGLETKSGLGSGVAKYSDT
jgi:trehalose/maltose hydrolase-like predicted phosphorylase